MRPSISFLLALAFGACSTKSDSKGDTAAATAGNSAPIADAGAPVSQSADTPVTLSGGGSRDPDGDPITFVWTFWHVPEGSTVDKKEAPFAKNHSADASSTTFTPDAVGTYIIELVVNDGKVDSAADTVIVTITAPESLPVANAGVDATSSVGNAVTLDGHASFDPQGRTLTYAWSVVDKPDASSLSGLTAGDTISPSFVPDARGAYVINLVVDNGLAKSSADAVAITVTGDDHGPTANAGADQPDAEDCSTIQVDCSASADPDGDALTYQWTVQSGPSKPAFADPKAAKTSFYPDVAGTYVLSCAVYDGKTWSGPDTMTVVASERRTNTKPVAEAGDNETIDGGSAECTPSGYVYNCGECADTTITLGSAARASDPDGDPYSLVWSVVDGDATITNTGLLTTTAKLENAEPTEPDKCEDVEYTFKLTVTDCTGATTEDEVTYTVSCCGTEG